jgi:hypothetical protein
MLRLFPYPIVYPSPTSSYQLLQQHKHAVAMEDPTAFVAERKYNLWCSQSHTHVWRARSVHSHHLWWPSPSCIRGRRQLTRQYVSLPFSTSVLISFTILWYLPLIIASCVLGGIAVLWPAVLLLYRRLYPSKRSLESSRNFDVLKYSSLSMSFLFSLCSFPLFASF